MAIPVLDKSKIMPIADRIYDPTGFYDEALTADGRPRPEYRTVLAALRGDLSGACEAVAERLDRANVLLR